MNADLKIIVLAKQQPVEQYVFIYSDKNSRDLIRVFAGFAFNPELNFNWYDAAILTRKVQEGWNPSLTPSRF